MIVKNDELIGKVLDAYTTRKVLCNDGSLMLVELNFKKGGIGTPHSHEAHEQIGYVVKGSFEVQVGEEKSILKAGDSYYAGFNQVHGVVALEDSVLIDIFTPIRKDFL